MRMVDDTGAIRCSEARAALHTYNFNEKPLRCRFEAGKYICTYGCQLQDTFCEQATILVRMMRNHTRAHEYCMSNARALSTAAREPRAHKANDQTLAGFHWQQEQHPKIAVLGAQRKE
jgi:hypothetical protein